MSLEHRLGSVRTRTAAAERAAASWAERARTRSATIEAAFSAGVRDRRRAGSLLAGGIAFRLFVWMLPAALVVAGIGQVLDLPASSQPDAIAGKLGLGASVASTIREATSVSDSTGFLLVVTGLAGTLVSSMSLVRALRVTHVLAWELPFVRRPHLLRDGVLVSAGIGGTLVVLTAVSYYRNRHGEIAIPLTALSAVVAGGAWLGLSWLLPHGDVGLRDLVPGAALFALAQTALHIATIYYFVPKLTAAPTLYGSLGTAATILAWLYLVARAIVASAFLNASLWRTRRP